MTLYTFNVEHNCGIINYSMRDGMSQALLYPFQVAKREGVDHGAFFEC